MDFEPFRDGEFVESEMGMIPEGWKVDSIYELINVIYGYPFKSKLFNDSQGIGLIRIRDLKNNYTGFFTTEIADDKYLVCPGDIVSGMDAEFKASIWVGDTSWLNQRVCKFEQKHPFVNKLFILHSVKPLLRKSEFGQVGTTVIHLGKSDIDKYRIIIPDEQTLMSINEIFTPIHQQIVNVEREKKMLSSLRDSLLPKLMAGEISVEQAERQL